MEHLKRAGKQAEDRSNHSERLHFAGEDSGENTGAREERRLHSERGAIHMTELLVVMPLALVMLTGVCMILQATFRAQQSSAARSQTTVETRNALERMSRELRAATVVVPIGGGQGVDFQRCANTACATRLWVRYSCTGKPATCTRYETTSASEWALDTLEGGGPANGTKMIGAVVNPSNNVFGFFGSFGTNGDPVADPISPIYMTITLNVGITTKDGVPSPRNPITLNDGFNLRNVVQL